jgi:hypothetical protein
VQRFVELGDERAEFDNGRFVDSRFTSGQPERGHLDARISQRRRPAVERGCAASGMGETDQTPLGIVARRRCRNPCVRHVGVVHYFVPRMRHVRR